MPRDVKQLFDEVRLHGNQANHALRGDHRAALNTLKLCWQLGLWFHRTFQDATFESGAFVPPIAPKNESEELHNELARLRGELERFRTSQQETTQQLAATTAHLTSYPTIGRQRTTPILVGKGSYFCESRSQANHTR